ncbi:cystatin-B-like [Actinia tenebrosa]|uniref:Cystatin-B-like n=1 Tax=Actinia tenebrosa TaxID=6105 RepID=A0A6P8HAV4_ACTTE|nr:cystatin-B-like [Actinia tenebrosa]
MSCGGLTDQKTADAEIQKICDEIKTAAEGKAGKSFSRFEAKFYASQVVAGTNFFIKVHVGEDSYVHVRVFRSLPHAGSTLELDSIQVDKSEADPITYF